MAAAYLGGVPVAELAKTYGIHRGSVSKHLRRHGITPTPGWTERAADHRSGQALPPGRFPGDDRHADGCDCAYGAVTVG